MTMFAGGLYIGLGVSLLYALTGLVGGMSSVFSSMWSYVTSRPYFHELKLVQCREWRLAYAADLSASAETWWLLLGGGARPFATHI